jgi:ribosomal protein S1
MLGRKRETEAAAPPAPAPAAKDISETLDVSATVTRLVFTLSNSYTYVHLAVFIPGSEDRKDMVLQRYTSAGSDDLALCQIGDKVTAKIYRSDPAHAWVLQSVKIIFDIEKERAAAEAAAQSAS